jgi:hypothetical protein
MKGHLASQGVKMEPPMSRDEYLTLVAEDKARQKTKRMPNA